MKPPRSLDYYAQEAQRFHAREYNKDESVLMAKPTLEAPRLPPGMMYRGGLKAELRKRLIDQDHAIEQIVPYVDMFKAGISPEGRPIGVFLLLGPTGSGKTKTVEALADVLHGSERNVLRVDCGEYQMDHEVAKLIGAPPGYLGHRETQPAITQVKLINATSTESGISLVLFDEIEKAADSMHRILLGVLDKGQLKLGDNTTVNFDRSMIFLTSNLGASQMKALMEPFGFRQAKVPDDSVRKSLASIGTNAVKRKFTPEFVNRIDGIITYHPLSKEGIDKILDLEIAALQRMLFYRLPEKNVVVLIDPSGREALVNQGFSKEFGARELKRVILRNITQPLAQIINAGGPTRVVVKGDGNKIVLETIKSLDKIPEIG